MKLRGAVLAAVVLIAGCSASESQQPTAGETGALTGVDVSGASSAQAAEISDRNVTTDEYEAAFQRFRDCLSASGFELEDVAFENSRYDYAVPNAAVEDGADAECYDAEFRYVDMIWQSSDEVQNNSDTARVIEACLRDRGIEPAGTLDEMTQQLREADIELPECL